MEREGLGVIFALTRLRQYLLGRKFKLIIDNKPLSAPLQKKLPAYASSRISRWVLQLLEFDFEVEVRRSE